MTAQRQPVPPSNFLRLFDPESGLPVHRIVDPVHAPSAPSAPLEPRLIPPPETPHPSPLTPHQATLFDPLECFRLLQAEHADPLVVLAEPERTRVRQTLTLGEFYRQHALPARLEQRLAGRVSQSTLAKERQALRRWEAWDAHASRTPANWPAGKAWDGLPIGFVTGKWVDGFLLHLTAKNARATVASTWNHLRTLFNLAVRLKALDAAPKPARLDLAAWNSSPRGDDGDGDNDENLFADTYTFAELPAIYRALAGLGGRSDLQTAFVLSVNAGPRTVDLFNFTWKNFRLNQPVPLLRYRAKKTGKAHGVPLAPCTVEHLRRLQRQQGVGKLFPVPAEQLVFPELTTPGSPDPERCKPARRRNGLMKAALAAAGVTVYEKPFQVGRATCNTRLENHRPGVGKFLLGHENTVNATSYLDPTERVVEAVLSLPQPAEFVL